MPISGDEIIPRCKRIQARHAVFGVNAPNIAIPQQNPNIVSYFNVSTWRSNLEWTYLSTEQDICTWFSVNEFIIKSSQSRFPTTLYDDQTGKIYPHLTFFQAFDLDLNESGYTLTCKLPRISWKSRKIVSGVHRKYVYIKTPQILVTTQSFFRTLLGF